MASGSTDSTVRLYDAHGTPLHTLDGHSGDVLAVAFSPNGTRLVSAAADFTAVLWDVAGSNGAGKRTGYARTYEGQRLIEWARQNRYVREWSCLERERYRILPLCETGTPGDT